MNLLRHYRFASFMIVLIAIAAFAVAELDFTTLFVGVVVAMLSWYVTEGPRGRTLPNWASNLLVLALVSYSGFSFVTDGEIGGAKPPCFARSARAPSAPSDIRQSIAVHTAAAAYANTMMPNTNCTLSRQPTRISIVASVKRWRSSFAVRRA